MPKPMPALGRVDSLSLHVPSHMCMGRQNLFVRWWQIALYANPMGSVPSLLCRQAGRPTLAWGPAPCLKPGAAVHLGKATGIMQWTHMVTLAVCPSLACLGYQCERLPTPSHNHRCGGQSVRVCLENEGNLTELWLGGEACLNHC